MKTRMKTLKFMYAWILLIKASIEQSEGRLGRNLFLSGSKEKSIYAIGIKRRKFQSI